MKQKTLVTAIASGTGLLLPALVALMVSVWLDTPRAAPFDAEFSLIDDRGSPVSKSIFKGRPSLVYFGYTQCPQACPTTLLEMSDWLNMLGEDGKSLQALFFSIDPDRDTRDVMHAYVAAFGDRITGVTGSPEEIKKVSGGWIIHAEKEPAENGDYHMNHTVDLLLIGADGRLKGLVPYGTGRDEALAKIRAVLLHPVMVEEDHGCGLEVAITGGISTSAYSVLDVEAAVGGRTATRAATSKTEAVISTVSTSSGSPQAATSPSSEPPAGRKT